MKKIIFLFFFVLLFFYPGLVEACDQLDSSQVIPVGFGAAYDVLSPGLETLISADCSTPSVEITVGNGSNYQYIYEKGYFYRDDAWESFTFSNYDPDPDNAWIIGKANVSIALSEAERLASNYVVVYICTWNGTEWKCGCRDSACTENYWQLQRFKYPTNICKDNDGDGYDSCSLGEAGDDGKQIDCDDNNNWANPGGFEVCDTVDNDCDGVIDEGCDDDGDGYCDSTMSLYGGNSMCLNNAYNGDGTQGQDCNDSAVNINPSVSEICDGVDNNCDKRIDEGCVCLDGETQVCGSDVGACQTGNQTCAGGVWGSCVGEIIPVAEICDGIDDNCDGTIDEGCECVNGQTQVCGSDVGACQSGNQTCTGGVWGSCVGEVIPVAEICDGIDNNCDGAIDEGGVCCVDTDGDGYDSCSVGEAGDDGKQIDCDDAQWFKNPGAPETCDNYDNNCNGTIDEGCDNDGDGYCTSAIKVYNYPVSVCPNTNLPNDSFGNDCDDSAVNINPSVSEICDGVDNDCDKAIDEDCNCLDGETQVCGSDVGACQTGNQTCAGGVWGSCVGEIIPVAEICDGVDNNCDGAIDEGCECVNGQTQVCGSDVGACQTGNQTCAGGVWGSCVGEVIPVAEICANSLDDNCDGEVDEGCGGTNLEAIIKEPISNINLSRGSSLGDLSQFFLGRAIGGTPPYSYEWSTAEKGIFSTKDYMNQSLSEWSDSIHKVTLTVTDANLTSASESVLVTIVPAETFFAKINYVDLDLSRTYSKYFMSARTTGGVEPYTYVWSDNKEGVFLTDKEGPVDISSWSLGVHEVTLTVTDNEGSVVTDTKTLNVFDFVASLWPDDGYYSEYTWDVYFNLYIIGGTAPYDVEIYSDLDGSLYSESVSTNYVGFQNDTLSIGLHKITFNITDANGKFYTVTNRVQVAPLTPITPEIILPENNTTFKQGDDMVFKAEATGGSSVGLYTYYWSSSLDGSFGEGKTLTVNDLSVGNHTIDLIAKDDKDNIGSASIDIIVLNPDPLTVSIDTPNSGSVYKFGDDLIEFISSVSGGVTPYTYSWSSSRDGILSSSSNVHKNDLSIGNHSINFTAIDAVGHSATDTINLTIDSSCKTNNIKNTSAYNNLEAFVISDSDWRSVLSLVPVTTWEEGGTLHNKPALIYHEETGGFDADSLIHFLQLYEPNKVTTIGTLPTDLNNLLVAASPTGAGLSIGEIENKTAADYFSYWDSFDSVVVVDYDNYKEALMASVFAARINSPIIFVNSSNLISYQSIIDNNSVYSVGDLDATTRNYIDNYATCTKSFSLEDLQKWYVADTGSNKITFVNPNDTGIILSSTYNTKKGQTISRLYSEMSLAAPFLAAARHEVIAYTELPSSGTNSSCATTDLIESNVTKADSDALYAIENFFNIKPEFFTIIASPLALPDSKWNGCYHSWQFRTVEDWRYGSVDTTAISSKELKTGRIYGISVTDASSYIARSLNFDYLNTKIYSGNDSLMTIGHNFDMDMNYARDIRNSAAASGYSAVCFTGEARDNCTVDLTPDYSYYKDRNYLGFLDHGSPYSWGYTIDSNHIPSIDLPVVVSAACLTNNFWQHSAKNFGVHMLRRGAIAHYGATGVSFLSQSSIAQNILQELTKGEMTTLGAVQQASHYTDYFSLLGDPALELQFKKITW